MKDKPVIFCVVGNSYCGKTTATEHVSKALAIPIVRSYTTRPMREGEEQGKEHIFVSEHDMPSQETMIAYTWFGGNHYWATKEQVSKDCLYVIDEDGLRMLVGKFGEEYTIVPILIKRDVHANDARSARDMYRECLPEEAFISVVENNGSLNDFLYDFTQVIKKCLDASWWIKGWYERHKRFMI